MWLKQYCLTSLYLDAVVERAFCCTLPLDLTICERFDTGLKYWWPYFKRCISPLTFCPNSCWLSLMFGFLTAAEQKAWQLNVIFSVPLVRYMASHSWSLFLIRYKYWKYKVWWKSWLIQLLVVGAVCGTTKGLYLSSVQSSSSQKWMCYPDYQAHSSFENKGLNTALKWYDEKNCL